MGRGKSVCVEGWMGREAKPTNLLGLRPFLSRKVNQKSRGERWSQSPGKIRSFAPSLSSRLLSNNCYFKYPISVAKMCFSDLLGQRGSPGEGVLGSVEAGGDSFTVELLWEGSGTGGLSWVGGSGGLGCGCSWGC